METLKVFIDWSQNDDKKTTPQCTLRNARGLIARVTPGESSGRPHRHLTENSVSRTIRVIRLL